MGNQRLSFTPRDPTFVERLSEELQGQNVLTLPLRAPVQIGAGALRGLSLGALDLTQEAQELTGLPDELSNILNITGDVAGTFIPFLGAANVAGKIFRGANLGARVARGAFTFGIPEISRQVINDEIDPLGMIRSGATGAAFSLPVGRLLSAPIVGATELALGAEPEEALAASAFALLFGTGKEGSKGREVPAQLPSGKVNRQLPPGPQILRTTPIPPPPQQLGAGGPLLLGPGRENLLGRGPIIGTNPVVGELPASTQFRPIGGAIITPPPPKQLPAPKNQVGLIRERVAEMAATRPDLARAGEQTIQQIESLQRFSSNELREALQVEAAANGQSPMSQLLRFALAQKTNSFAPPNSSIMNGLSMRAAKGVDIVPSGPTNPIDRRSAFLDALDVMRAQGPEGATRATMLETLWNDAAATSARAKAAGRAVPPEEVRGFVQRQEQLLSGEPLRFKNALEAESAARREIEMMSTPTQIDDFMERLPTYYKLGSHFEGNLRAAAEDQKRVLAETVTLNQILGDQPKGFNDLARLASDHGAVIAAKTRTTTRGPERKIRYVTDNFTLTFDGARVRKFNSVKKAQAFVQGLEEGTIAPKTVPELRMLAYPRGLVINDTGRELQIVNQITGEVVPADSVREAIGVVRRSPNIANAAREHGPRAGAIPPMPGTGGIGGVRSELPPPSCPVDFEGD